MTVDSESGINSALKPAHGALEWKVKKNFSFARYLFQLNISGIFLLEPILKFFGEEKAGDDEETSARD